MARKTLGRHVPCTPAPYFELGPSAATGLRSGTRPSPAERARARGRKRERGCERRRERRFLDLDLDLDLDLVSHLVSHLRSEEHTSELQSRENLVCRLLLEKKKKTNISISLYKPIKKKI